MKYVSAVRITLYVFVVVGGLMTAIGIGADWIGLGKTPGFGQGRRLLTSVGSITLLVGVGLFTILNAVQNQNKRLFLKGLVLGMLLIILGSSPILLNFWWLPKKYSESQRSIKVKDTLVKNMVISAYPSINKKGISDFERVSLIRKWASRKIVSSNEEGLLDYDRDLDFYHQDAATILAAFMKDKGGVWCKGSSYFLVKLYELFDYKAFFISVGDDESGFIHTFPLVEINRDGRKILSIQDASFNLTYIHADGRPMDYFELIELLKQRRHEDIITDSSAIRRDILYFDESGNLKSKVRGFYGLHDFEKQFYPELISFCNRYGFPRNILYMHLSFLGISEDSPSPPGGKIKFYLELAKRGVKIKGKSYISLISP